MDDSGRTQRIYKARRAMTHMFFQAATLTGAGTGDADLFRVACAGDPARTALWLTSSLSAGAVIEVFLFQIVGRATDHTGRKAPWLFLSPGMSCATGLACGLASPWLPVVWFSRLLTSSFSALFGGMNMTSAMLSDVLQPDELAQAFSLLVAVTGAGLFIGTQTGSFLHRAFGDPRYGHLGRAFFAACGFIHNLTIPVSSTACTRSSLLMMQCSHDDCSALTRSFCFATRKRCRRQSESANRCSWLMQTHWDFSGC